MAKNLITNTLTKTKIPDSSVDKIVGVFSENGLAGVLLLLVVIYMYFDKKNIISIIKNNNSNNSSNSSNSNDQNNLLVEQINEINKIEHNKLNSKIDNIENQITIQFNEIKKELSDVYLVAKKNDDENTLNNKHEALLRKQLASMIPYLPNEELRRFVIKNCLTLIKWIINSKNHIFIDESSFKLSIEEAKNILRASSNEASKLFNEEYVNLLFSNIKGEVEKFFQKLESIYNDKINDKINKFIMTSTIYMQDSTSLTLSVWEEYIKKNNINKSFHEDNDDGLDIIRKIEKDLNS